MVTLYHMSLITVSLVLLAKSVVCQPIHDNEHKPVYQEINESDLRYLIAKTLSRHPLGILGHIIVEAVDKAGVDGHKPESMSVRDRRYQTATNLNDQSFLRFGRNSNRNNKRPKDTAYDLNDRSFLRFGRSWSPES
ncbi:unnamed protein product [Medioppia subpectinata]|uniref:Uncharacterized protein n=1 Tax=Medioppia subpectinata TaxID=1979941 RepID=A0A7R9Q4W9_9ACAR|nr:unnamed protein product [Medioppia subpectinata]CAG2112754.1 unnamed protein product [Medioppia subpectinata]